VRTEKPRKPGGAGARVLACSQPMVSQGTHAARQPGGGRSRGRQAPRARSARRQSRQHLHINSLTSGKTVFVCLAVSPSRAATRPMAQAAQAALAAISHLSLESNDAVVAVVALMRDEGYQAGQQLEIQRECCRMMADLTESACTEAVLASGAASMLVRAMTSLVQARGFGLG
jgi:hypothetical protein